MKRTTTLLIAAIAIAAMALTTIQRPNGDIVEKLKLDQIHADYPWMFERYTDKNKRTQHTGWYSYVDAAASGGVTWTNITNTSLFPDSTVYQLYGATGGGTELGFTGLHNIGEVFDPKYEFFPDGERMSRFNTYKCDSVAFVYRYSYNKPGTVDTLRIQFYGNAQIQNVNFTNGDSSVSLQYNSAQNRSTSPNFISEIEILLDQDDTTGDDPANAKLMSVAIPGGGIDINPNGRTARNAGLCAFTITYHPGYTYSFGDTLQHDWDNPPVVNKLNHFRIRRVSDRNNFPNSSMNKGLFIFTDNLYDNANSGWPNLFIPGNAFNDSKDHLYALFHCISDNTIGVNNPDNGYGLGNAYPNPVNVGSNLNIDFALGNAENVTIELISISGAKVATIINNENYNAGEHTITFNTANIPAGMYFYTIKAGNYTATKKVSIY